MLPWPLHHIGIAVNDLDAAIALHTKALGCSVSWREELTESGVALAFLDLPNTKLELIAPIRSDSQNTLTKFLNTRGPGLHHLCYSVTGIKSELTRLESLGFSAIDIVPRRGAHGSRIAFLKPAPFDGVLVELCEDVGPEPRRD